MEECMPWGMIGRPAGAPFVSHAWRHLSKKSTNSSKNETNDRLLVSL